MSYQTRITQNALYDDVIKPAAADSNPFLKSVWQRDIKTIKALFSASNSLQNKRKLANLRDQNGRPAIFFAAVFNDIQLLKLLIANGADIRNIDQKKRTILHYAAMNGGKELISYILQVYKKVKVTNLTKIQQYEEIQKKAAERIRRKSRKSMMYSVDNTINYFSQKISSKNDTFHQPLHIIRSYRRQKNKQVPFSDKKIQQPTVPHVKNTFQRRKSIYKQPNEQPFLVTQQSTLAYPIMSTELALQLQQQEITNKIKANFKQQFYKSKIFQHSLKNPINILDKDGKTPLHIAVLRSNAVAVDILVAQNASLYIRDMNLKIAIDYADPNADQNIHKYLTRNMKLVQENFIKYKTAIRFKFSQALKGQIKSNSSKQEVINKYIQNVPQFQINRQSYLQKIELSNKLQFDAAA